MAAVVPLPFTLPKADPSAKTAASVSLSAPTEATLFPAGPSYISHARRQLRQLDFDADDQAEEARLSALSKFVQPEDDVELPDEEESKDLLNRDPKDWKTQDHYAVLGLSSLRYKASFDQIKAAHRRKVLKHHPDKKAGASGLTNDDTFYKCITRAYDILSHPEKRRQFDSVDEGIDDEAVPSGKESEAKFFQLWTPVFEREARFCLAKAPSLGNMDSSKADVDAFYDFWYNFDSWRSFEYLDKEINEGSDSRDDKRYTEKKNRNERARRKKEDNARLRSLVDKALSVDPRIKKFKAEEKAAREAKRMKKPGQAGPTNGLTPALLQQKEEEERKRKEEEAKQAEADKTARADAKKAREAAKKNLKKHKKVLRDLIMANNYFQPSGSSPSASVIEARLNGLDAICAALSEEPEKVQALRERCEKAGSSDDVKQELAAVASLSATAKDAFA